MAIIVKGTVKIARPIVPTDIAGLQLWLDASDSTTLFTDSAGTTLATADGDPIGCWKDKSANGRHVTNTDGTKKPTLKNAIKNGKNSITFNGTLKFLQFIGNAFDQIHIFVVAYVNPSIVDYAGVIGYDPPLHLFVRRFTTASQKWGHNNYADFSYDSGYRINGTTNTYNQNNGTWGIISSLSSVNYNLSKIYIGGCNDNFNNRIWHGYVAEIIVYQSSSSDSKISVIENYLNTKWGVY